MVRSDGSEPGIPARSERPWLGAASQRGVVQEGEDRGVSLRVLETADRSRPLRFAS